MMTPAEMAAAFNEWMREYTDNPEDFEAEFKTVMEFLNETANGTEPSYGDRCAALLARYHERLNTPATR